MVIYLDTCCLQRPLDDRSQARINIEAEAVLTILGLVEKGHVTLASSDILENEISRIPDDNRKNKVIELLGISRKYISLNDEIELQAREYTKIGIKPMDALHLASAIVARVDYFCTTDDRLLKKAKMCDTLDTKTTSLLEIIIEVAS